MFSFNIKDLYHHTFSKKDSAGFTLVELIIVISVISALSIVGIASYVSYSRAQTLNAAAGDLAVMLNLAKSRAYSQVKPYNVSCQGNPLEGYEVRICSGSTCDGTTDSPSFALYVKCGGSTPVSTATFSNLTFTSPPPTVYSFFFPVLKGSVAGSGTITITNDFDETRNVTVDQSGNIRIEK